MSAETDSHPDGFGQELDEDVVPVSIHLQRWPVMSSGFRSAVVCLNDSYKLKDVLSFGGFARNKANPGGLYASALPPAYATARFDNQMEKDGVRGISMRDNTTEVALKCFYHTRIGTTGQVISTGKLVKNFEEEVYNLNHIANYIHKNIVEIVDVCIIKCAIVLEYIAEGDFERFCVGINRIIWLEDRKKYALAVSNILNGLEFLSDMKIVHRDLSPRNILVKGDIRGSNDFVLKLSDFGRCFLKLNDDIFIPVDQCAPFPFCSPEATNFTLHRGLKMDVWSLGCISATMLAGFMPFPEDTVRTLSEIKSKTFLDAIEKATMKLSILASLMDFIKKTVVWKPEERSSVSELIAHSFVAEPYKHTSAVKKTNAVKYTVRWNPDNDDELATAYYNLS